MGRLPHNAIDRIGVRRRSMAPDGARPRRRCDFPAPSLSPFRYLRRFPLLGGWGASVSGCLSLPEVRAGADIVFAARSGFVPFLPVGR